MDERHETDPSNVYDLYVTVKAPTPGSVQSDNLGRWLESQYPGEDASSEELEHARHRMNLDRFCPIRLTLQRNGEYVPTVLQIGKDQYQLLPIRFSSIVVKEKAEASGWEDYQALREELRIALDLLSLSLGPEGQLEWVAGAVQDPYSELLTHVLLLNPIVQEARIEP